MNKRAVIFTGGLGPDLEKVEKIIKEAEITLAADSGWDLATKMGVVPQYFIGDMDSIKDSETLKLIPSERIFEYPVDKDLTDTELAIKFLKDRDYHDIVLIGGGEGRIDHLLAILSIFNRDFKPAEWFTANEHIFFADKDVYYQCEKNQTVSIFSCWNEAAEITSQGLKWEMKDFQLNSTSFSISNIALENQFSLKVKKGAVLVILNY